MTPQQYQSMTVQCKMEDVFNGRFITEDWLLIIQALKSYVISQEEVLRTKNVGDREWQELEQYSTIARDIEYYVISLGKSNER